MKRKLLIVLWVLIMLITACGQESTYKKQENKTEKKTNEKNNTNRLTKEEKELMKSFIPSKYLDTLNGDFDANYPNQNGTNNVIVQIQNTSFDNIDSCMDVYKGFIGKLYDSGLYKKVYDCTINFIGTKNSVLKHMIWIDGLYNKEREESIKAIKTKSFN